MHNFKDIHGGEETGMTINSERNAEFDCPISPNNQHMGFGAKEDCLSDKLNN